MAKYFNQNMSTTKPIEPDGYIGIVKVRFGGFGGKIFRYIYLSHLSEPYGFSCDYPDSFDCGDFTLNNSAFGLWDSKDELLANFKKYAASRGYEMKLTAIMPVTAKVHFNVCGEVINPNNETK